MGFPNKILKQGMNAQKSNPTAKVILMHRDECTESNPTAKVILMHGNECTESNPTKSNPNAPEWMHKK